MAYSRTDERQFNKALLVLAPQAAYDSPVLDFTAAGGQVVWARSVNASENPQQDNFQGSSGSIMEHSAGVQLSFKRPEIVVEFYPTPTVIDLFLRSFAGPKSGSTYPLPKDIVTWYSFLYAEAPDGESGFKAYRFENAWVRELTFEVGGFGVAICRANIIAEKVTPFDTDAVGLVYPALISDDIQFAHRSAVLINDPTGANVELAIKSMSLNLRHGFTHEPFNSEWAKITKQGLFEATGQLVGRFMDETSDVRAQAIAETYNRYQFDLVNGSDILRFDLYRVCWEPAPLGFANRDVLDFVQPFRAASPDPFVYNTVDIRLI